MADDDHEQIVVRQDRETGLRFIVAVHSTVLGPALGGMRLKRYPGGLREALDDVMGLARTMTLKASAAGLDLGGGKSVMIDDGRPELREARLEAAARVIDGLDGAYITAEDIGTTTADMDHMAGFTRYAVGRSESNGGGGDPSPVTAETVFQAMRRGLAAATGSGDFDGRRVGVVGLGKVGSALAARLARGGRARDRLRPRRRARRERLADEHGLAVAPSAEAILASELDVLAPCAAGGLIDDALARSIDCRVVAGAANNPLTDRGVARTLMERDIVYVPDFLANCGGLIHVLEWSGTGTAGCDGAEAEREPDRGRHGAARLRPRDRRGRRRPAHRGGRASGARARGGCAKAVAPWSPPDILEAGLESSFEPVSSRRTFEEAVEQIAERIKSGDLHVGDRLPSRARARRDHADQPPDAARGRQDARRGRRARGAPRPVRRHLRRLRADPARPAAQPPGDPRERGGRRARGAPPARAARGTAGGGARERGGLRGDGRADRAQANARGADDFLENEDLFLQLDLKFHLAMARATRNSTVVQLMRSLFRRLEIARDMAVHAPLVPDWVISIHERTLAAIRAADFPLIDEVMDEHLAQLEQIWERETGRGLVRPLPDFLQPVADRSRALRAG